MFYDRTLKNYELHAIKVTWYNLIFFHVFKRYYKNGRHKNDIPWLTASGIVGVSSLLYLFIITALTYFLVNGEMPEFDGKYSLLFCTSFVALNWMWFTGGNRYLEIYNGFKDKYTEDKLTEALSWSYVFGAYIVFIVVIITLKM
ncbi:hypothetical protein [Pontibacter chinhatensis]|uniref:Uncharacterized protein n=1 Tax=Pontibacter chinhatensis TaxID=1436961 RepID=A0A1I2Z9S0_9BACT|nr:hypothetical protein [Pontibacter chinhatensis]SFH34612.1 hypothetical protein SAMN05421739_11256 [Pontibacter chinhatensis]